MQLVTKSPVGVKKKCDAKVWLAGKNVHASTRLILIGNEIV